MADQSIYDGYQSIYKGAEIDRRLTDVDNRIPLPSPAYAGLFPMATAQGGIQWVPRGQPTDAQTAAAISAWLAAHPEATTTVQDGSITAAKLLPAFLATIAEKRVLLWENDDPSATFADQTLVITGLADYTFALVTYRPYVSESGRSVGLISLTGSWARIVAEFNSAIRFRRFRRTSAGLVIDPGKTVTTYSGGSGGETTSNDAIIPVEIYGIK